jgi:membrane fusion protein, copper/silver efflux system
MMNVESIPSLVPPPAPPAPQSAKRKYGIGALLIVALVSAGATAGGGVVLSHRHGAVSDGVEHEGQGAAVYQCPMHPAVVQDHPGECPICGMKLVKADKGQSVPASPAAKRILFYRSPMDAKQTSPVPRKDGMGMDYLPVYEADVSDAPPVAGLANVEIDAVRQQLIGLKTAEVTEGPIGGAWRTVGRVAIDETRVRHVNLKVPGFVERIYVDFVGKKVKKGDPLFSIYSPELLSAQEEFLLASRTKRALAAAPGRGNDGDDLVSAARRKLALWDIPAAQIAKLESTGQSQKTLTLFSPVAGVVTRKDVVEGMKLDAGAMPYEIVDLSSVWVLADVYESELRFATEGMTATLKLAAFPSRAFEGRVVFVDPLMNPETRTVKLRLTFPNPKGELRPEMFGEVVLSSAPHDALRIPLDAVIDSGTEKVVFVAQGEGKFQPRKVTLGDSDGAQVEVLSGLTKAERVVIRANFLIDSESRLRASLSDTAPSTASPAPLQSARALGAVGQAP